MRRGAVAGVPIGQIARPLTRAGEHVGFTPNMLLVRSGFPVYSSRFADVLAGARQRPGYLSYGHAGNGTSPHLAGELLKYLAKVEIAAIPYKGGAPSLNDWSAAMSRSRSTTSRNRSRRCGLAPCVRWA